MFGIPGKAAVTLTPAAVRRVRQIMEAGASAGLRVGVRKGGCAGMEYTLEHAAEVGAPNWSATTLGSSRSLARRSMVLAKLPTCAPTTQLVRRMSPLTPESRTAISPSSLVCPYTPSGPGGSSGR